MIYLIDEDAGFRDSLAHVSRENKIEFRGFASFEGFCENSRIDAPSCLLLDLQREEAGGLDVIRHLRVELKYVAPIIVVAGASSTSHAVSSIKRGAVDYFEKPVDPDRLIAAAKDNLITDATRAFRRAALEELRVRLSGLTSRQRQIIPLICSGASNKRIAQQLHLSMNTVFKHRALLIKTAGAENTADLVRLLSIAEQNHLMPRTTTNDHYPSPFVQAKYIAQGNYENSSGQKQH